MVLTIEKHKSNNIVGSHHYVSLVYECAFWKDQICLFEVYYRNVTHHHLECFLTLNV